MNERSPSSSTTVPPQEEAEGLSPSSGIQGKKDNGCLVLVQGKCNVGTRLRSKTVRRIRVFTHIGRLRPSREDTLRLETSLKALKKLQLIDACCSIPTIVDTVPGPVNATLVTNHVPTAGVNAWHGGRRNDGGNEVSSSACPGVAHINYSFKTL
jgi:hypothetical protein